MNDGMMRSIDKLVLRNKICCKGRHVQHTPQHCRYYLIVYHCVDVDVSYPNSFDDGSIGYLN